MFQFNTFINLNFWEKKLLLTNGLCIEFAWTELLDRCLTTFFLYHYSLYFSMWSKISSHVYTWHSALFSTVWNTYPALSSVSSVALGLKACQDSSLKLIKTIRQRSQWFYCFPGCMLCFGQSNFFRFNHPEEAFRMKSMMPKGGIVSTMDYKICTGKYV